MSGDNSTLVTKCLSICQVRVNPLSSPWTLPKASPFPWLPDSVPSLQRWWRRRQSLLAIGGVQGESNIPEEEIRNTDGFIHFFLFSFFLLFFSSLLCTLPGQRSCTTVGVEGRGRAGSIVFFLIIHYFHI